MFDAPNIFTDTVTVYHWTGAAYTRKVINGVQWRERAREITDSAGIVTYNHTVSVTVPYEAAHTLTLDPTTGQDLIVYGVVATTPAAETLEAFFRAYPKALVVKEVVDNTYRPLLRHHRIIAARG